MTKVLVVYSILETFVVPLHSYDTNIYFFLISYYLHAAATGFRNSDIHR